MASSGMLHRVALVSTDVSSETFLQEPQGVTFQKTQFFVVLPDLILPLKSIPDWRVHLGVAAVTSRATGDGDLVVGSGLGCTAGHPVRGVATQS
jgi:hypothetical protein